MGSKDHRIELSIPKINPDKKTGKTSPGDVSRFFFSIPFFYYPVAFSKSEAGCLQIGQI